MAKQDDRKRFVCFKVEELGLVRKILNRWLAKRGRNVSEAGIDHAQETEGGFCVFISFFNWLEGKDGEEIESELVKIAAQYGLSCPTACLKLAS